MKQFLQVILQRRACQQQLVRDAVTGQQAEELQINRESNRWAKMILQ